MHESAIEFAPTYPINDDDAVEYAPTRLPAWCDRVLYDTSAQRMMSDVSYNALGIDMRTGDHKVSEWKLAMKTPLDYLSRCRSTSQSN